MNVFSATLLCICALCTTMPVAAAQSRDAALVKFAETPSPDQIEAMEREGVMIGDHVGGGSYFASVRSGELEEAKARLSAADIAVQLDEIPTALKLKPLGPAADLPTDGEAVSVLVKPTAGETDDNVRLVLEALDVQASKAQLSEGWLVNVAPDRLEELAASPQIQAIFPAKQFPSLGN